MVVRYERRRARKFMGRRESFIFIAHVLLQLSSLAFRGRIERSTSVGDGPRHDLANTDWAMTAGPWRLIESSLAVENPFGRGKGRANGATLGGIRSRGVHGGLRNTEPSERCWSTRRARRPDEGRWGDHGSRGRFMSFMAARTRTSGARWGRGGRRFARRLIREERAPTRRRTGDGRRKRLEKFCISCRGRDGSPNAVFLFDDVEEARGRAFGQFRR